MDNKNIESFYPLSPMQQGMLFHSLFAPDSGVYVEQLRATLQGNLNVAAFAQTWQLLVDRHPILRSAFAWEGLKEPIQVVQRTAPVVLEQQDWRGLSAAEQCQRLADFAAHDQVAGFDLGQAPLIRLALLRTADDTVEFVWTHHHILLDGWSVPLLLGELFAAYAALARRVEPQLPPRRPFRDYIAWLRKQNLTAAESYWRQALAGFTAPTSLTVGRDRPGREAASQPAEMEVTLSAAATAALEAFARQHRVTLNTVVLGAWAALLSRYSGEEDVCFGVTVSGRPADLPGADAMLGLFINTLPMRVQVPADQPVAQWLPTLQAQQVLMRQYEYSPLAQVQTWSDAPRGVPLFESIFVFENLPAGKAAAGQAVGDLRIQHIHSSSHTNYPLTVVAVPDREMLLKIGYDASRFDAATIERMMDHWQNLLAGLAATAGQQPPRRVPMLSTAEQAALLPQSTPSFPAARTIHEWVEAQTAATPDAVAVVAPAGAAAGDAAKAATMARPPAIPRLTYADLNSRANQLARALRAHGVGPETLVALYVERSLDMVVAILGILKAGGAYVPMDPAYPPDRLAYLAQDTQTPLVLTQQAMRDTALAFSAAGTAVICLDSDWPAISQHSAADLPPVATPDNTAYVIYTSGSTGKPKGVMVTHANVVRLFEATEAWYHFDANDVWTLFHSYAFDFSVWELWGALFYGGRLVVVPYLVSRSPELMLALLRQERVTVLNQTPSAFRQLIRAEEAEPQGETEAGEDLALRYVIFGGEALELESLRPWFLRHGDQRPLLVNMYGITETTVHVTYRPIHLADLDAANGSVIGVPIPDLHVILLDQQGQLVPIGVPGEIYVGGAGLARGYLNRPELTEERFIASPFAVPSARLYRSGDLARWLPNGDLEYLGRIDHQVKIRGFRIELGEIETVLTQHPSVRETVVLAREDLAASASADGREAGYKRLVAYFVPTTSDTTPAPTIAELRAFLGEKLPDYMVPAAFVAMERLPLTTHGKVDRRALPAPSTGAAQQAEDAPAGVAGRLDTGTPYVAPRTEQEEAMAAIWAQALGVGHVGIHDNFFELGGDSILSLQVISRAKQAGLPFTPRLLFENPTVASLVAALGGEPVVADTQVEQGLVTGPVPLTPVQHWFFEHHADAPHHFNTSMLLVTPPDLDEVALAAAVAQLVAHHDALRLQFTRADSGWLQVCAGLPETPPFVQIDLPETTPEAIEAQAAAIQASFRLDGPAAGSLLRVVHLRLRRSDNADGAARSSPPGRLLICLHHLVGDGVSWRVLMEDLVAGYEQARRGLPVQLLPKTTSYQAWAEHLVAYAQRQSDAGQSDAAWWTAMAAAAAVAPALPVDHPDGAGRNTYGSTDEVTVSLSSTLTQDLLQMQPAATQPTPGGAPVASAVEAALLTALVRACSGWTGAPRLLVEMEGHGRQADAIAPGLDLSRTVGWFTSIYPLLLDLEGVHDLPGQLQAVGQQLHAVPQRGIGYGVLRYLSADPALRQQLASMPSPQINFNYLGQVVPALAASADAPTQTLIAGMAAESPGPEQNPAGLRSALLYVVAIVTDGGLDMRWLYSRAVHERSTVKRLANATLDELRNIIAVAGHSRNTA